MSLASVLSEHNVRVRACVSVRITPYLELFEQPGLEQREHIAVGLRAHDVQVQVAIAQVAVSDDLGGEGNDGHHESSAAEFDACLSLHNGAEECVWGAVPSPWRFAIACASSLRGCTSHSRATRRRTCTRSPPSRAPLRSSHAASTRPGPVYQVGKRRTRAREGM